MHPATEQRDLAVVLPCSNDAEGSTISGDAIKEILRGSQGGDSVIVPMDRAAIDYLLAESDDLDDEIEKLIVKAIND